jgi:Ni/Fe-hydrogenase 1 B-type cytochrome subunit
VRNLHYVTMFLIWAFTVHHVYSALLVSVEEKNGLMGSIFSGHKFIPLWRLRLDEHNDRTDRAPRPARPDRRKAA